MGIGMKRKFPLLHIPFSRFFFERKPAPSFVLSKEKTNFVAHFKIFISGTEGFEPTNIGTKNRCLTTWRRPIVHPKISSKKERVRCFQRGPDMICFFLKKKFWASFQNSIFKKKNQLFRHCLFT
jgi:hypothetical protein